jgi:hypothetical protein
MNMRLTSGRHAKKTAGKSMPNHAAPSRASKKIGKKKPREFQG